MIESGINIKSEFMDTSPSNGVVFYDPYVKFINGSPSKADRGDSHKYYQSLDCENDTNHIWPRFQSESGIQSEPSFMDYRNISMPEDWF